MFTHVARLLTAGCFHNPIFVVGTGRSGTSIMLQGLGQHAQVLAADRESPFLPYVGYLAHPFTLRENKRYHLESLNMDVQEVYQQLRRLCFESVFGRQYGLHSTFTLSAFRRVIAKKAWCAKTYPNQTEALSLLELYPSARFVYMHRSGCSVVNSRSQFKGMSKGSFEDNCRIWAGHVKKYQYLSNLTQATLVRQEDIAEDPDGVFKRVQAFAGLDHDDAPTRFARTTLIHPLDQRTKRADVAQVFRQRLPVYDAWTAEQRSIFKALCEEGMNALGYEMPF